MRESDPDNVAVAFDFAHSLEHTGFLFLLAIRRPPVIGPAFDIEPGMGQGTERGREIIEAFLQQFTRHGVNHLARKSDFYRRIPVFFPVLGVDRDHDMNKLMHQHAENLGRLIEIGADEDFEMLIGRGGGMPAFAHSIAFPSRGRKPNRKSYLVRQGMAP